MADGGYDAAQNAAASLGGTAVGGGCAECHTGKWIHVRYEYTEGDPVTDAVFVVQKPNGGQPGGEIIHEGIISVGPDSNHQYVHVDLDDDAGDVEVFFFDDPTDPVPFEEPNPVEDERNFFGRAADNLMAVADWTGEVAMGDFNEDMTTAQILTNAGITAIPVVDQVADLRDLIANGKALIWDKRYGEIGVWVGLFACLIGLIPTLGSLVKGVIKIIWKNVGEIGKTIIYINKITHNLPGKIGDSVVKINGYRFLRDLARDLPGYVNQVSQKFDEFLDIWLERIPSWAVETRQTFATVRAMAREKFGQVATEISERILRGLTRFASVAWRVAPGNSIVVRRTTQAMRKAYDSWQDTMYRVDFDKEALEAGAEPLDDVIRARALDARALGAKWADEFLADPNLPRYLREQAEASPEHFRKQMSTFGSKPTYETFGPGQSLYRVIKDADGHTGGFWSKSPPPNDEAAWRARDAVLNTWNPGGAFIRVEVPPPPAGFVGEIAPQISENSADHFLRGGGEQVWLPAPRGGAVSQSQVKSYWHTGWNDRGVTNPSRASVRAGRHNECDK